MSVREEDRQKNCPSRGLGLAAAAIGVGVGAALYYFFSKSPEQPACEGSTSSNWSSEEAQALSQDMSSSDSSETTERYEESDEMSTDNNTSDSSSSSSSDTEDSSSHEDLTMNTSSDSLSTLSDISIQSESNESFMFSNISNTSTNDFRGMLVDGWLGYFIPNGTRSPNDSSSDSHETLHTPHRQNESNEYNGINTPRRNDSRLRMIQAASVDSDIDTRDWDVTNSLLGLPDANEPSLSASTLIRMYENIISEYSLYLSGTNSRERVRTIEDCSICFEPMLHDQQLVTLSCTHQFHSACIRPWLNEQNTCPNCRKYTTA